MRRERNIKKTCQRCGVTFYAATNRAIRCEECREIYDKESHAIYRRQYKAMKIAKSKEPDKSISQVLRELKQYNEKNGTNLSYGKYIVMCEGVK